MSPDYERMLERFYCQVLQNGDIAVDVGAHIGRHTFPMASSIGTRGLVYAFEPLPVQFKNLVMVFKEILMEILNCLITH